MRKYLLRKLGVVLYYASLPVHLLSDSLLKLDEWIARKLAAYANWIDNG